MSKLQLTRYLYARDEVEYSLVLALIQKRTLEECYYWAAELFYSGFSASLTKRIWTTYYDFYAQYRPRLEYYIELELRKAEKDMNNFEPYMAIIKNMRLCTPTDTVFVIGLLNVNDLTVYRGKIPKWAKKFTKQDRPLVRAIENLNWSNIMYRLDRAKQEPTHHCEIIIETLISLGLIDCKRPCHKDVINSLWRRISCPNDTHRLVALICSLLTADNMIDTRNIFVKVAQHELEYITQLNEEPENMKPPYLLASKRCFQINPLIGHFELVRDRYSEKGELAREYKMFWEYHSSQTPLWMERFEQYKATVQGKELVFHGDENGTMFDKFYDRYQYDLDESYMANVLALSCGPIEYKKDLHTLMTLLFDSNVGDDLSRRIQTISLESISSHQTVEDSLNMESLKSVLNTI